MSKKRRTTIWFLVLAGVQLLCVLFYGFIVPQTAGRMGRSSTALIEELPLWSWIAAQPVPVPQDGVLVAGLLLTVAVAAFAAYALAAVLSCRTADARPHLLVAVVPGVLLSCAATCNLPNATTDIFDYIMRGRVSAVYGENPYLTAGNHYPDDPLYPYSSSRYMRNPSEKLPAWTAMNVTLARLAGDDPVTSLLVYRCVLFAFHTANIGLIVLILRRLKPDRTFFGVVFYAWNPIVVNLAHCKSDTVMLCYLLAGLLLMVSGYRKLAAVPLVLSVLVKLTTLPLLALFWLSEVKQRSVANVVCGAALGALATFLVYLPFSHDAGFGAQHLTSIGNATGLGPSLKLFSHTPSSPAVSTKSVLKRAARLGGVAVLCLALIGIGLKQADDPLTLLRGWSVVLLCFSLFLTRMGMAHYLIVPIAVVALAAEWRLAAAMTVIGFNSFLCTSWDTTFNEQFPVPELFAGPRLVVYLLVPAIALAALLLLRRKGEPAMTAA